VLNGRQILFSRGGENHPPVDPGKEPDTEELFEGSDLMTDGRRGDVQDLRSPVEAAVTGGGFEAAQAV